jgi:hypothetical protein
MVFVLGLMAQMFTAAFFADVGAVSALGVLLVRELGKLVPGYVVGTYDALLACHLLLSWYFVDVVIFLFDFAFSAAACGYRSGIESLGRC